MKVLCAIFCGCVALAGLDGLFGAASGLAFCVGVLGAAIFMALANREAREDA